MKEPIESLKEWLNDYKEPSISVKTVLGLIEAYEKEYDNAFIDKLIEEGRLAESIKHHAKEVTIKNEK